jgi:hypothetical protein
VPVPDELRLVTPIVDPRHMSRRTRRRRRRGWMQFVHVPHLLVELLAFLFFPILLNHYNMYRSGLVLWWYLKTISCGGKSLGGVELWSSHLIMTCSVIFRIWHVVPADWLARYYSLIISVASLGRCIFIGHNIVLGHARALLPFHMAFSTCLIGKWKWLRAWAINPANIVHVGGCVFCWRVCLATKSGRYPNVVYSKGVCGALHIIQVPS